MNNIKAERIGKEFITNTCVQVSIPYEEAISIIGKDGLLYHHNNNSLSYSLVSNYLEDERGKFFPNNEIVKFKGKLGLKNYNFANQVFNYYEPYIVIADGKIEENYVIKNGDFNDYFIKDDNKAILVKEELPSNVKTVYLNRIELERLYKAQKDEQIFILKDKGGIYYGFDSHNNLLGTFNIPTEKQIVNINKRKYYEELDTQEKGILGNKTDENIKRLSTIRTLKDIVDTISIDNIKGGLPLYDNDMIVVKIKDGVIKVQDIYSYLVEPNKYKVQIMDLPIHDYTMEELLLSNVKIKKNKVLSRIFRK